MMQVKSKYSSFTYEVLIKESHLDTFGHVNNATYLQLLEEARWEFISTRGFDLHSIQRLGLGPIILELNIKFMQELRLRQKISIVSEILSYENKIATMQQDIFNEKHELCSQTKITFGLFDLHARKLILPTREWLHAIGSRED